MSRPADEIFNDALERSAEERDRFLTEACTGDPLLRHEVESLLRAYEADDTALLPRLPPAVPARIGSYAIRSEVARSGMGVVYLAEDERLRRRVAIKVLPARLAGEPAGLERFQREGRMLAALDHPNIATIYSLEEAAGVHFITMEWVDGETLAERIRGQPLPRPEALSVCLQIARALEAAHARGVVHRDLKPLNVKVRPDGKVKLLDFGLARAFGEAGANAVLEHGKAIGESFAAGTPGYMAPEQVRGADVDHRADIWAFGCILYEAFTGRPAMPVGSGTEPASAPTVPLDLAPLRTVAPESVVELASRALEPDRELRLADMTVACRAIESALSTARRRPSFQRPLVAGFAGLAGLAALLLLRDASVRPGERDASGGPAIPHTDHYQLTHTGTARVPDIRPDGSAIAWIDGRNVLSLWMQALPGGKPRELQRFLSATQVRWSPDGLSLLVSGRQAGAATMAIVHVASSDGAVLGNYDYHPFLAWAPDGSKFASGDVDGEARVTEIRTGKWRPLLDTPPWKRVQSLDWSPEGRFLVVRGTGEPGGRMWMVDPETGVATLVPLEHEVWSPRWTDDGKALMVVDFEEELWQVPVDPRTGLLLGPPASVLPVSGVGSLGFSCTGDGSRIIYPRGPGRGNVWMLDLATRETTRITAGSFEDRRARISPDQSRLLVTRRVKGFGSEVFVMPAAGGEPVRLTSYRTSVYAAWSPDGRRIAFHMVDSSKLFIAVAQADGSEMRRFEQAETSGAVAWSPGRTIVFPSPGGHRIRELDPDTGSVRDLYGCGQDSQVWQPQWAPDGRRLAVLETPTRGTAPPGIVVFEPRTGNRTTVHVELATPVAWSQDGRWIYVVAPRRPLESMPNPGVRTPKPVAELAAAAPLLALLRVPSTGGAADTVAVLPHPVDMWSSVDVTPDGRRAVYCAADFISDIWMFDRTFE